MALRRSLIYAVTALAMLVQARWAQAQTTYMVGDNNGWTFPPNGIATFYNDWAKEYGIKAGDSLFFDYQYNYHDVVQVSKADLDACSAANPINTYKQGNSTVPLPTAGYYGFICSFPSHCAGNMKVEINVLETDGSPAPVAPPVPPVGGPSTAPGSPGSPAGAPDPSSQQSGACPRYQAISAMAFGTVLAATALFLI